VSRLVDGRPGYWWSENALFDYGVPARIGSSPTLTYLALIRHANAESECFPSIALLSLETGLSNRVLATSLKALAGVGMVGVTREKHQRNLYRVASVLEAATRNGWQRVQVTKSHVARDEKSPEHVTKGHTKEYPKKEDSTKESSTSSSAPVLPFRSEEEVRTSKELNGLERARYYACKNRPDSRDAALAVMRAGVNVWRAMVDLAKIAGASDTTFTAWIRTLAGDLDSHGPERVLAALELTVGKPLEKPKAAFDYYRSALARGVFPVASAVTVLPPVNIDDRKRQLQDELAAHFAELDKEFGLAAGGN
jgi:hypothetical protein